MPSEVGTQCSVLVAIPTFRRVELLEPLIAEIRRQMTELDPAIRCRVCIVDNDPLRSAMSAASHLEIDYVPEPRPGIAFARQRALDEGRSSDGVIMIDDDLRPLRGCIERLIAVWREYGATIVVGKVHYVWPKSTDAWIVAGGFMRRDTHPTGSRLRSLASGNILIDSADVRRMELSFDTSLGLSGGEDTEFGFQVHRKGGAIIAADDAVAIDEIPTLRATRDFVRRRTIGQGVTRTNFELGSRSGWRRATLQAVLFLAGCMRFCIFLGGHLLGVATRNLAMDAISQRRAWFAIGRIRGTLGRESDEYSRS